MTSLYFIQRVAAERAKNWHGPEGVNAWTPERWCVATLGELGEAANALKKGFRMDDGIANVSEEGREIKTDEALRAKLADELADVLLYLVLLAERLEIDLQEATARKFNATSLRYGFPQQLVPMPEGPLVHLVTMWMQSDTPVGRRIHAQALGMAMLDILERATIVPGIGEIVAKIAGVDAGDDLPQDARAEIATYLEAIGQ